jgi:hypothetical protein
MMFKKLLPSLRKGSFAGQEGAWVNQPLRSPTLYPSKSLVLLQTLLATRIAKRSQVLAAGLQIHTFSNANPLRSDWGLGHLRHR